MHAKMRPGASLSAHGTVIACRVFDKTEEEDVNLGTQITYHSIVFCVREVYTPTYVTDPYVTWERWTSVLKSDPTVIVADSFSWGHYHLSLDMAVADYDHRVESKTHEKADIDAISARGVNDGRAAATWLIDGNTDAPLAVLEGLIQGIDEGDPEVLDSLPMPHLGGEWSDNPTWEDICKEELDRYEDGEDDLLNVYHHSFHEGVEQQIREMHRDLMAV